MLVVLVDGVSEDPGHGRVAPWSAYYLHPRKAQGPGKGQGILCEDRQSLLTYGHT